VRADGYAIDLTAIQNVREFVGYDLDGHKDVWDYLESRGANAEPLGHRTRDSRAPAPEPVPIFRDRTAESKAILWDGQTMVLGGLSGKTQPTVNKAPLLGDLLLAGTFFMSPRQDKRTNVLIFITPALVNGAGKPLHKAEDMPFSENAVPPQMPRRTPAR
jgi:Flp pilus assembly secretin CpaC